MAEQNPTLCFHEHAIFIQYVEYVIFFVFLVRRTSSYKVNFSDLALKQLILLLKPTSIKSS